MADENEFKKYKQGEKDDDNGSVEQVPEDEAEPSHEEEEYIQRSKIYTTRHPTYQSTARRAHTERGRYQSQRSGYTPKTFAANEYVRRTPSANTHPREYAPRDEELEYAHRDDSTPLNNNTTLRNPAVYSRFPLNIIGTPTKHHFHFLNEKGIIIEYELDTTPWSSVFIQYSHKVLRILVPISMNRDYLDKVNWTETGSRAWKINVAYTYSEDDIAAFLWDKTRKIGH